MADTGLALAQEGWYLSPEGIEACTTSTKVDIKDVIGIALNKNKLLIGVHRWKKEHGYQGDWN